MNKAERCPIKKDLVVIGAGMSGLTLATEMQNKGWSVAVIDKARGSGGRLSSKRLKIDDLESAETSVSYDLGCADFSARTPEFRERVQTWISQGHVQSINVGEQIRYMAVPRSSSLTRYMANRLTTYFETRISKIIQIKHQWHCYEQASDGEMSLVSISDHLVLAIPPAQAAALLANSDKGSDNNIGSDINAGTENNLENRLRSIVVEPQWVTMLMLDDQNSLMFESQQLKEKGISLIRCESDKPGREALSGTKIWMIHMDHEWSQKHINLDAEQVSTKVRALIEQLRGNAIPPGKSHSHRWLYSQISNPLSVDSQGLMLDQGLYACGDWIVDKLLLTAEECEGVERAFLSAMQLSKMFSQDFQPGS